MTRDTILRKVQALLNLGDKDKNTSEAEAAAAQKWDIRDIRPNTSNGDVLAFLLGQRDGDKVPLNIRSTLPEGK